MRRTITRTAGGVVTAGALVAFRPGSPANKMVRRGLDEAGRKLRYGAGRIQGVSYRLAGRHPDPEVDDGTLADRIRSELGGIEKRRDLPHVHVMVEHHVALLHGEVPTQDDADAIEAAVAAVSGVRGVKSHLHIGLLEGDTRPSAGHVQEQS